MTLPLLPPTPASSLSAVRYRSLVPLTVRRRRCARARAAEWEEMREALAGKLSPL